MNTNDSALPNQSLADPWLRNPFPEGTKAHQICKETMLWAKEHIALLQSELLESMPPEAASSQAFLDHVLKMQGGRFDIWARAFWRSRPAELTDDAAIDFEHLLAEIEKAMLAQADDILVSFISKSIFSREIRSRLNQRKQYWTGQMLKAVREHKEASRAKIATPKAQEAAPTEPVAVPNADAGEDASILWPLKLRSARENAKLSRPDAAKRLKNQGIQITADAIKKHEEGKAKPKPDVRKAYAEIYKTPESAL